eukprot:Nk52_evm69s343 gene=Nk52_evmTU69s343
MSSVTLVEVGKLSIDSTFRSLLELHPGGAGGGKEEVREVYQEGGGGGWDVPEDEWGSEEEGEGGEGDDLGANSGDKGRGKSMAVSGSGTSGSRWNNEHQREWFRDCLFSVSPGCDCMAIFTSEKFAVIHISRREQSGQTHSGHSDGKANSRSSAEFSMVGEPICAGEGETIEDIACIPIVLRERRVGGGRGGGGQVYSRTCIIVGYSTGYIRVFSEDGHLLMTRLFHKTPVKKLKITSVAPEDYFRDIVDDKMEFATDGSPITGKNGGSTTTRTRTRQRVADFQDINETSLQMEGISEDNQPSLVVLFEDACAFIDGLSLYGCMRSCISQLERRHHESLEMAVEISAPPLNYKKYEFLHQDDTQDILYCGPLKTSLFDALKVGVRAQPQVAQKYITVGCYPMIGYYTVSLNEVASFSAVDLGITVASKLTSAVFSLAKSWWSGGDEEQSHAGTEEQATDVVIEKPVPVEMNFGINDKRRRITSIISDPTNELAVTTDMFGRVLLLDTKEMLLLRMWKGYRDAQCGWIESLEELGNEDGKDSSDSNRGKEKAVTTTTYGPQTNKKTGPSKKKSKVRRRACFLVIFAPRRGIVEIWSPRLSRRVDAFNVGPSCVLLYAGFKSSYVPLTSLIKNKHSDNVTADKCKLARCFLMRENGSVQDICVPFHCSLSDDHGAKARDLHLVHKMTESMRKLVAQGAFSNAKVDEQAVSVAKSKIDKFMDEMASPESLLRAIDSFLVTGIPSSFIKSSTLGVREKIVARLPEGYETMPKFSKMVPMIGLRVHMLDSFSKFDSYQSKANTLEVERKEFCLDILDLETKEEPQAYVRLLNQMNRKVCSVVGNSDLEGKSCEDFCSIGNIFGTPANCSTYVSCLGCVNDIGKVAGENYVLQLKPDLPEEVLLGLGSLLFTPIVSKTLTLKEYCNALKDSGVIVLEMFKLFVKWFFTVGSDSVDGQKFLLLMCCAPYFERLYGLLDFLLGSCLDIMAALDVLGNVLGATTPIGHGKAVILGLVVRSVLGKLNLKESGVVSKWNILVHRVIDVNVLSLHLSNSCIADNMLTINNILVKRDAEEENDQYLAIVGVTIPRVLALHLVNQNSNPFKLESWFEDKIDEEDQEMWKKSNAILLQHFRFYCNRDTIAVHCALELFFRWSKNREASISALDHAVAYVEVVEDKHLQLSLCLYLWKQYAAPICFELLTLVDKVRKCPKDRLCRKAVDMGNDIMPQVLNIFRKILSLIRNGTEPKEVKSPPLRERKSSADPVVASFYLAESNLPNTEDLRRRWVWEDRVCTLKNYAVDRIHSFCGKVISGSVDGRMLETHINICDVLIIVFLLDLRNSKPSDLFDSALKGAFFKTLLWPHNLAKAECSETVSQARTTFLLRAVSMARNPDVANRVFSLVASFKLPDDVFRRRYVCTLFELGRDSLAEEQYLLVKDKDKLPEALVDVAGRRLYKNLVHESASAEADLDDVSRLPADVYEWIMNYGIEMRSNTKNSVPTAMTTLANTKALLLLCANLLAKDSRQRTFLDKLSGSLDSLIARRTNK